MLDGDSIWPTSGSNPHVEIREGYPYIPGASEPVSDELLVRSKIDVWNCSDLRPAMTCEDSGVLRSISDLMASQRLRSVSCAAPSTILSSGFKCRDKCL